MKDTTVQKSDGSLSVLTRPEIIDRLRKQHEGVDGEFRTKAATITTPSIDRTERLVKGFVSVATPDMDNEVVIPGGLDRSYFPKMVKSVYYGHDYSKKPIGVCRSMTVKDGGRAMYCSTYILPGAEGDDLLTAIEHGAINGFSVGFTAEDYGPPTKEEVKEYGHCDTIVRRGKLIEYSIVAMPCCPAALMDLAAKSLIHRSSVERFGGVEAQAVASKSAICLVGGNVWKRKAG